MDYVRNLSDITNELFAAQWDISHFEALTIAVQVQKNQLFAAAFMLDHKGPGALEAIAMELGAEITGDTIKSALREIANNLIHE